MARKIAEVNFEERFLDELGKRMDRHDGGLQRIEQKVDQNTVLTQEVKKQAETTNGRVAVLEKEVFGSSKMNAKSLPPWYRDEKILKIITICAFAVLILVAAAAGFDLKNIIL